MHRRNKNLHLCVSRQTPRVLFNRASHEIVIVLKRRAQPRADVDHQDRRQAFFRIDWVAPLFHFSLQVGYP
jgi:hypothetical protein